MLHHLTHSLFYKTGGSQAYKGIQSYLAANLLVNGVGGDSHGVGVLLQFTGLEVEVCCSLSFVAGEAQHALLRNKAAAAVAGTHCQAHLHLHHTQLRTAHTLISDMQHTISWTASAMSGRRLK